MADFIDGILNKITMYRLVLYLLIFLVAVGAFYGALGLVPFSPLSVIVSTSVILAFSLGTNYVFSKVYDAPVNTESAYITALILVLIYTPPKTLGEIPALIWAAVLSMSVKYIIAVKRKHIFNPAAAAAVLTSLGIGTSASWWIGNAPMAALVAVSGYLIVRKLKRDDMVFSFLTAALIGGAVITVFKNQSLLIFLKQIFLQSSLFFLAGFMLTEPLTMPPGKIRQIIYGTMTGILFLPQVHFGRFYTTPEIALLIANLYAYIVSPKEKLWLTVKEKIETAPGTVDFIFNPGKKAAFVPGQYMEWTLPHNGVDSRGNRRYFTIASSPTEEDLRLGVKFYENGSSYKKAMLSMDRTRPIIASQLSGDFTLPRDRQKKLVFIAGGIGVTPFRSMIKYLIDTKDMRSVTLFYSNKFAGEIIYRDVFDEAEKTIGLKTVYNLTDISAAPSDWTGKLGRINARMIMDEVPDYKDRTYYLSGPQSMVKSYEKIIASLGVPKSRIIEDYFPGFV